MKTLCKLLSFVFISFVSMSAFAQKTEPIQKENNSLVMGTGQLNLYNSLQAILEDFDFDYKYDIVSYDAILIQKSIDVAQTAKGHGSMFNKNQSVQALIKSAKPGDVLIFENVKVKGKDQPERFAKGGLTIKVR